MLLAYGCRFILSLSIRGMLVALILTAGQVKLNLGPSVQSSVPVDNNGEL